MEVKNLKNQNRTVNAYSIYDAKAQIYWSPMFTDNDELALRAFYYTVDSNPVMKAWPEDFQLFFIGQFSESNGEFYPAGEFDVPKEYLVGKASDHVENENE